MRRLMRMLGVAVVAALLVAVGWWASRTALEPPSSPLPETSPVFYTVKEGTVGRSLQLAAVAEWPLADLGRSGADGTVTSVDIVSGAMVDVGDVVYSVDLRPVIIAEGAVPMFRELSLRTEGRDVAQLQRLLGSLGIYDGEADDTFGAATREAVREWQKRLGVVADGVVRRGDVVFVADLPTRVVLTEEMTVGAPLTSGTVTMRQVTGDPTFRIPLAPEQRSLVPLQTEVRVSHGAATWDGVVAEAREDRSQGQLLLILQGRAGGALCGKDCAAEIPLMGLSDFPAEVVVVPETEGPLVPMAAIQTAPDGTTSIQADDGTEVPVTIVSQSDGMAIVDGIERGDVIILPATNQEDAGGGGG